MTAPTSPVLCGPWATYADLSAAQQALADEPTWNGWLLAASEQLYALTQQRWPGVGCSPITVTVRSVPGEWPYDSSWGSCSCWDAGQWLGATFIPSPFGSWAGTHTAPVAVKLPHPYPSDVSVTINGDVFTAWRVSGTGWVERTDGRPWPVCHPDTVEITYTPGKAPPAGGVRAAVSLAAELLKASIGQPCRLPRNVTAVTRQGVTQQRSAPVDALDGLTGLVEVDQWIRSVNPGRRATRGRVWSPDIPGTVRVTGGP